MVCYEWFSCLLIMVVVNVAKTKTAIKHLWVWFIKLSLAYFIGNYSQNSFENPRKVHESPMAQGEKNKNKMLALLSNMDIDCCKKWHNFIKKIFFTQYWLSCPLNYAFTVFPTGEMRINIYQAFVAVFEPTKEITLYFLSSHKKGVTRTEWK